MNERIKELIRQAGGIDEDDDGYELTPILVGTCLVKFADLIVRECMSVCIDDIADPRDTTELKCAKKIKEHFGVKE